MRLRCLSKSFTRQKFSGNRRHAGRLWREPVDHVLLKLVVLEKFLPAEVILSASRTVLETPDLQRLVLDCIRNVEGFLNLQISTL
jgi:hypothetical protein